MRQKKLSDYLSFKKHYDRQILLEKYLKKN